MTKEIEKERVVREWMTERGFYSDTPPFVRHFQRISDAYCVGAIEAQDAVQLLRDLHWLQSIHDSFLEDHRWLWTEPQILGSPWSPYRTEGIVAEDSE